MCKLHFPMSFQFVRVCDILLYGLNDIFAYVGSIHKTYLLSVIKFVAATTSLLEAFVKSFQKKTEIFTKKIKPYSLEKSGIQSFLGSLLFRVFHSGSSVGSFSRVWF